MQSVLPFFFFLIKDPLNLEKAAAAAAMLKLPVY